MIDNTTPMFIQIKEQIKDDIMAGVYEVDDLIISTTQIAKFFSVNPATAVKSVSFLQDEGIVYKKKGIGMCVTAEAKNLIVQERTTQFYDHVISTMVNEAKKLGIDKGHLIEIIKEIKDYD